MARRAATTTLMVKRRIRQRLLIPQRLERLQRRLGELAAADQSTMEADCSMSAKQTQLVDLESQVEVAKRNLARATSDAHYHAVAGVFDELVLKANSLRTEIANLGSTRARQTEPQSTVADAMQMLERLT